MTDGRKNMEKTISLHLRRGITNFDIAMCFIFIKSGIYTSRQNFSIINDELADITDK